MNILFNFIDGMFWVDIVFNFFMAYEKEDLRVEHDRKKIVCNYLSGWFLIDFFSVFPFDIFYIHFLKFSKLLVQEFITVLLAIKQNLLLMVLWIF